MPLRIPIPIVVGVDGVRGELKGNGTAMGIRFLWEQLFPWHRPKDIPRYLWYMTRDIAAVVCRVRYHGYLRISRVNSPKTQKRPNSVQLKQRRNERNGYPLHPLQGLPFISLWRTSMPPSH